MRHPYRSSLVSNRLAPEADCLGKGYAGEAAREWLRFGFETIGLEEIVAFTIPDNLPSQRVMEKIGMTRDLEGDFLHPSLPADHPIAKHVLYRLKKTDWMSGPKQV